MSPARPSPAPPLPRVVALELAAGVLLVTLALWQVAPAAGQGFLGAVFLFGRPLVGWIHR